MFAWYFKVLNSCVEVSLRVFHIRNEVEVFCDYSFNNTSKRAASAQSKLDPELDRDRVFAPRDCVATGLAAFL